MEKEENNGFGPFYRERGSGATWAAIALLVAFVVAIFVAERSLQPDVLAFYFFAFSFSLLACIVGEMARRICLFWEESRHCSSRYEGSMKKALKAVFDYENSKLVTAFIGMTVCIGIYASLYDVWYSYNIQFTRLFFFNAIFMPLFVFLFGLRKLSRVEYSQFNEKEKKNIADGLAWGYYIGYLKFVLPSLKEQINLSPKKYRSNIEVAKVFIIIPKNCYVDDQISNEQIDPNGLVDVFGNLEPLQKDHGGIKYRSYKHTVHSIEDAGKTHYCVMEYATPLKNLYNMSLYAGLSKEERDIQVNLFVVKLKEILDSDPKCEGMYQLVTFGGENQDIAKIMISALKDCPVEVDEKDAK